MQDTETATRTMLAVMVEAQRAAGLTGEAFAASIGVSGPQWSHIRKGARPLSLPVVQAFLRTYPVSTADLQLFLNGDR